MDETIPKAEHIKRINVKNGRIAELEDQLKAATARATEAEASMKSFDVNSFEDRIGRLTEERDQAVATFEDFRTTTTAREALLTAGVTDSEDQDLVRWRYERLPEADRPDLGAWLASGAREDRHLAALWEAPSNAREGVRSASEASKAPAMLPDVNNGVKPPTAPPAALTREAIMAMPLSERAKPENRDRIMAALSID